MRGKNDLKEKILKKEKAEIINKKWAKYQITHEGLQITFRCPQIINVKKQIL